MSAGLILEVRESAGTMGGARATLNSRRHNTDDRLVPGGDHLGKAARHRAAPRTSAIRGHPLRRATDRATTAAAASAAAVLDRSPRGHPIRTLPGAAVQRAAVRETDP